MSEPIHAVCPHCNCRQPHRPLTARRPRPCAASANSLLFSGKPIALTSETSTSTSSATTCRSSSNSGGSGAAPAGRWRRPDRAAKEVEPAPASPRSMSTRSRPLPARYGIRGIPTLIVFDDGKVMKQHAGVVNMEFLRGLAR